MFRALFVTVLGLWIFTNAAATSARAGDLPAQQLAFRPPAVPLVTSNPYLSVWSMADRLTDDETRHWTRREHPLTSLIRIDGKTYRLMGKTPEHIPPLPQVGVRVLPLRTIYDFEDTEVHVRLTFVTPALPDDLAVLARPLTYVTWEVNSKGSGAHTVSIFASASARLAADPPGQAVSWLREGLESLTSLRVGTVSQRVLQRAGDDTSIDWGYLYIAAPSAITSYATGKRAALADQFSASGMLGPGGGNEGAASGTANGADFALAFSFRRVPGRSSASLAASHDRIRRDLRDQVPRSKAQAILAARRGHSGRSAARRRTRLRTPGRALCGF